MKLQKYFGYTIVNNILKSQKLSIILLGFIGLAPNDHHLNPYIFSRAPTFRLQAVRLLTTRLQQFVSTTIRLHYNSSPLLFVFHYYSSPLLFVSTTFVSTTIRLHYFCLHYYSSPYNSYPAIRLHYYSSPLLFVSTTFCLQTIRLLTILLQQFVSTTIRLHYYSSPLLFVSITIRLHYYSSPLLFVFTKFVSTTIRLHYYSDQLQFYYI